MAPSIPRCFLACNCTTSACVFLSLPPHLCLLFCLSQISRYLSFIRTFVIGFSAHPGNSGWSHFKILNYICKDPFSKYGNMPFPGIRIWTRIWGNHHLTQYRVSTFPNGALNHRASSCPGPNWVPRNRNIGLWLPATPSFLNIAPHITCPPVPRLSWQPMRSVSGQPTSICSLKQ